MKINPFAVIIVYSLQLLGCAQQNKIAETYKASTFTPEKVLPVDVKDRQ
jgi:hypothetical protein